MRNIIKCVLIICFVVIIIPTTASHKQSYKLDANVSIIELSNLDYENERHIRPLYELLVHPRAFLRTIDYYTYKEYKIFIDKDSFFLNEHDKELLILHELGHVSGKEDELIGTMSFSGIIRYLTA